MELADPAAIEHADIARRLLLDVVAILIFSIGIYYRRHRRSDLAMVFAFFNLCLFVAVSVIQLTELAAALGFGLFAILSIIRLRSEPFDNREIGYFFGALVLGLVNGIGTDAVWFTLVLNATLIVAMLVLDHPMLLRGEQRRRVVLDRIETDEAALREVLEQRLGVEVGRVSLESVDYVRDSMVVDVHVRPQSSTMRRVLVVERREVAR